MFVPVFFFSFQAGISSGEKHEDKKTKKKYHNIDIATRQLKIYSDTQAKWISCLCKIKTDFFFNFRRLQLLLSIFLKMLKLY